MEMNYNPSVINVICKAFSAVAGLMLPIYIGAQDFNPTVEVSRQYKGSLVEVHKPAMDMALPDSVEKFNLQFDYSVFDNPYKGSYEFKPYLLNMNLDQAGYQGRKFYLKAGAGYSLHPTMDLVWTPVSGEKFRMSLYASHNSYIGRYRTLGLSEPRPSDSRLVLDRVKDKTYRGHDLLSKAGISGEFDWKKGDLFFDASYYGVAAKDTLMKKGYDAFDFKFGLASKFDTLGHFVYDIRAHYRYGEEKIVKGLPDNLYLTEHVFDMNARLGYSAGGRHSGLLDVSYNLAQYGAAFDNSSGCLSFVPRYIYDHGRWQVDFGIKLAFLLRNDGHAATEEMYGQKGQIIYPDVNVAFTAVKGHLDIYAKVSGGPQLNTYSSLLGSNHHISPLYNPSGMPLLNFSEESIGAALGLRGSIASRFGFDLSAGYSSYASLPLESIYSFDGTKYTPVIGYVPAQLYWANLDYNVTTSSFDLMGRFRVQGTDRVVPYFSLPSFSGFIDARYNWKRRIFVGVDCDFALARRGGVIVAESQEFRPVIVPGYADLGVYFEFAFNRKFSLWARGGNLLDMTIQRNLLYSESGINFTAGILLNL